MRSIKKSVLRKRLAIAVGILLLLVGADYYLFPYSGRSGQSLHFPSNGVWLTFDFAAGKNIETPAELGTRMRANRLRDAFFHVRYIGQSGRLRYDIHQTARVLNREMKREAPGVRRFAWLFIGNERAITGVDISRPEVRSRIVAVCRELVFQDGFDGLQVDYEICPSGDANFLRLLQEIRAATRGKVLSVATPLWVPVPLGPHGWSNDYFAQVARWCDQIGVMAYDSALYSPRLYVWLMREQVIRVPRAVAATPCRVVIGVPTYKAGGFSHDAHTENLANALRGIQEGMAGNPFADRVDGVAVFADYTTDAEEWAIWRAAVGRK